MSDGLGSGFNPEKPKLTEESVKDLIKEIKRLTKIKANQVVNFALLYQFEDYQEIVENIFEFNKFTDGYKAIELLEILKAYLVGQELSLEREKEKRTHFWSK